MSVTDYRSEARFELAGGRVVIRYEQHARHNARAAGAWYSHVSNPGGPSGHGNRSGSGNTVERLFVQPGRCDDHGGQPDSDALAALAAKIEALISLIDKIILQLTGEPFDGTDPRAIDGSGNHLAKPTLGRSETPTARLLPVGYADGMSEPANANRPGPREVSNAVLAQTVETGGNRANASDMFWQWGQFIDHDLALTHAEQEAAPISLPAGDRWFDPAGTGGASMPFIRSNYELDSAGTRQHVNSVTHLLDGSMVYGSNAETAAALRSFEGGRLRTGEGDLLPRDEQGQFLAGDERAGEQPGLSAIHTVFMREHNRVADELAAKNPEWRDEQLYQAARQQVTAQIQVITYQEFLPILLGPDALPAYEGYRADVDPRISASFATAAFRFGHSMVSPELQRLDPDGNSLDGGPLPLQDGFFAPALIERDGVDPYLRGLIAQEAQELDHQVIDPLRNMLFGPPGAGGMDLVALNIQRGRDHGLPGWNEARTALGLSRVESFDDPRLRDGVGAALAAVYASPDDVDLWVGGLSETPVGGGLVGDTFRGILVDQFTRMRDADRYWYQNLYSGAALRELERTTLADIIQRNTEISGLGESALTTT